MPGLMQGIVKILTMTDVTRQSSNSVNQPKDQKHSAQASPPVLMALLPEAPAQQDEVSMQIEDFDEFTFAEVLTEEELAATKEKRKLLGLSGRNSTSGISFHNKFGKTPALNGGSLGYNNPHWSGS